jgi:type II secretory pathway component PulC
MWLLALLLLHDKSGDAILKRNIFCSDCRPTRPAKALRLLATFTDHWNGAIICRIGGPCALVEIGNRLADAVVVEIEERRVRFDDGDALELDARTTAAPKRVEKADPRWLDHPEELVRTVTAVPDKDGVRIIALRPGSPLARLGLQRGDLVRAVNGCELAGVDAALGCYQRLRNVRYVSVSLLRAGAPVTLDVALDRE